MIDLIYNENDLKHVKQQYEIISLRRLFWVHNACDLFVNQTKGVVTIIKVVMNPLLLLVGSSKQ